MLTFSEEGSELESYTTIEQTVLLANELMRSSSSSVQKDLLGYCLGTSLLI